MLMPNPNTASVRFDHSAPGVRKLPVEPRLREPHCVFAAGCWGDRALLCLERLDCADYCLYRLPAEQQTGRLSAVFRGAHHVARPTASEGDHRRATGLRL